MHVELGHLLGHQLLHHLPLLGGHFGEFLIPLRETKAHRNCRHFGEEGGRLPTVFLKNRLHLRIGGEGLGLGRIFQFFQGLAERFQFLGYGRQRLDHLGDIARFENFNGPLGSPLCLKIEGKKEKENDCFSGEGIVSVHGVVKAKRTACIKG